MKIAYSIKVISLVCLFVITGCATKSTGIGQGFSTALSQNTAQLTALDGITIVKIDNTRISSILEVMFKTGKTMVTIDAGNHSILASKGRDLRIGNINYLANNNYSIRSKTKGRKIYYWVENTTVDKVVWGTKID